MLIFEDIIPRDGRLKELSNSWNSTHLETAKWDLYIGVKLTDQFRVQQLLPFQYCDTTSAGLFKIENIFGTK